MSLSNLGQKMRTNRVDIGPEKVTKHFNQFAIAMLWSFLERKKLTSAKTRYEREKRLTQKFESDPNLNTPEIVDFDDQRLMLAFKKLHLIDLVDMFQNPNIHPDDKLELLRSALLQLQAIHNQGETHGDPYLKNFFQIGKTGRVYTCDFEQERSGPNPEITDIVILTANAISLLESFGIPPQAPLSIVDEVYGKIKGQFDGRDYIFLRTRFGVDHDFFGHFGQPRTRLPKN